MGVSGFRVRPLVILTEDVSWRSKDFWKVKQHKISNVAPQNLRTYANRNNHRPPPTANTTTHDHHQLPSPPPPQPPPQSPSPAPPLPRSTNTAHHFSLLPYEDDATGATKRYDTKEEAFIDLATWLLEQQHVVGVFDQVTLLNRQPQDYDASLSASEVGSGSVHTETTSARLEPVDNMFMMAPRGRPADRATSALAPRPASMPPPSPSRGTAAGCLIGMSTGRARTGSSDAGDATTPSWHGLARLGTAWHDSVWFGTVSHGLARLGTAWHGLVWLGTGLARLGTA